MCTCVHARRRGALHSHLSAQASKGCPAGGPDRENGWWWPQCSLCPHDVPGQTNSGFPGARSPRASRQTQALGGHSAEQTLCAMNSGPAGTWLWLVVYKEISCMFLSSCHHEADTTPWGSVFRRHRALHGGDPIWGWPKLAGPER